MAVESELDRLGMVNPEEFGSVVTRPDSPGTFYGIFDSGHLQIDNAIAVISTVTPTLMCRTSDVADLEQDDELTVQGIAHTIADIQQDGTGMTLLVLHKA